MTSSIALTCYMLKKVLPHVLSVLAFLVISVAYYSPVVTKGERVYAGDSIHYKGMSHETISYEDIEGERPQWTDSMFGGMPTVQITGSGIMTLPKYIWSFFRLFLTAEMMTLFVAMLSAYVLALCLKAPPIVAFISGITFGLASVNVLYLAAGHATKVRAISLMPGILGGVIYTYRENKWGGAAIAALFLAMHIDANHLQMTYYLMFMIGAVGITEMVYAIYNKAIKSFLVSSVLLIVAATISILPSLPSLALTKDYSHHTTRGEVILNNASDIEASGLDKDYILQYSMSKGEWLSAVIPNIKGGSERVNFDPYGPLPIYWGDQAGSSGAFYFGAIAFALLTFMFFGTRERLKWPVIIVGGLAIILSWRDASFVTDFFLDNVPMFSKFRDTKMMLVLIQLSVVLGVTVSLKKIWDKANSNYIKGLAISFGSLLGMLLVFLAVPKMIFDFEPSIAPDRLAGLPDLISTRVGVFRADVLRSMVFIMLAGVGLTAVLMSKVKKEIVFGILAFVMLLDIWSVDKRYDTKFVSEDQVNFPHEASEIAMLILDRESAQIPNFNKEYERQLEALKEKFSLKINKVNVEKKFEVESNVAKFRALNQNSHFRVYDLTNPMNDAQTSYFFKSIGGYHGAKLRRYQDFIEHQITPFEYAGPISQLIEKMRGPNMTEEEQTKIMRTANYYFQNIPMQPLNMLNCKYVYDSRFGFANENPGALGPAWMVHHIEWVETDDDELMTLQDLDVSKIAVMHNEFAELMPELATIDSTSTLDQVELIKYHPEGSTYKVKSEMGGLLVLSEIWYPDGWTATVDGEQTDLVRANYILRALPVEAGEHNVVLSYEPPKAEMAGVASNIGSILLLLFVVGGWFMCCRSCERKEA